jgi:hypothetical protein
MIDLDRLPELGRIPAKRLSGVGMGRLPAALKHHMLWRIEHDHALPGRREVLRCEGAHPWRLG